MAFANSGSIGKRREQRPCDACRKKKIRCDSQITGGRCLYCIERNMSCTFIEKPPQRNVPKGYVEDLEARVKALESLATKVGIDYGRDIGPSVSLHSWTKGAATSQRTPRESKQNSPKGVFPGLSSSLRLSRTPRLPSLTPENSDVLESSEDEGHYPTCHFASSTDDLQSQVGTVFYGKSSSAPMLSSAHKIKHEAEQVVFGNVASQQTRQVYCPNKRQEYWTDPPWEWAAETTRTTEDMSALQFPPPDLSSELVHLYFQYMAPIYPLINKATFEDQVSSGEYRRDRRLATIYLLVCAIASRWSNDPRVCASNDDEDEADFTTGGQRYFLEALALNRRHISLRAPKLQDIQITALLTIFLQVSASANIAWIIAGVGIRLAMQLALNRKRAYDSYDVLHGQMLKRAFWCLVLLERQIASALGRSCAIQDEDMDVDFPVEVDDDYWGQDSGTCHQPPDQPSRLSFFTSYAQLHQLLAFVLRTIYSIRRSRIHLGFVGPDWERRTVSEIDSALNEWMGSVPKHLSWTPEISDPTFFMQSAHLQLMFYGLQLLVHRPFMPESPRALSILADTSMVVCTHASRAISNILRVYSSRKGAMTSTVLVSAFNAGVALLIAIWRTRKVGGKVEHANMDAFHQCVYVLKEAESHLVSAGRLCDVLTSLAAAGDSPFPPPEASAPSLNSVGSTSVDTPYGTNSTPASVPASTCSNANPSSTDGSMPSLPAVGTYAASYFATAPPSMPSTHEGDVQSENNSRCFGQHDFGSNAWNYHLGGGTMNVAASSHEPITSSVEARDSSIFQDGVMNDSWLNNILGFTPMVGNAGMEGIDALTGDPNWDPLSFDGAGVINAAGGNSDAERQWQSFVLNNVAKTGDLSKSTSL